MSSTWHIIFFAILVKILVEIPHTASFDYDAFTMLMVENQYYFPICVARAPSLSKLVKINYYLKNLTDANAYTKMYFCPLSQSEQENFKQKNGIEYGECLRPNDTEDDTCPEPVKPLIKTKLMDRPYETQKCGEAEEEHKILYFFGYQLCMTSGDNVLPYMVKPIYQVCYDHYEKTTVYVKYKIISAHLIGNALMRKGGKDAQTEILSDNYGINSFEDDFEGKSFKYKEDDELTEMMLVSPDDMAKDVWTKPLFHKINTKPMYTRFVEAWNSIRKYIRTRAKEKLGDLTIYVGTLNEVDGIPSIWWIAVLVDTNNLGRRIVYMILHNTKEDFVDKPLCNGNGICDKLYWDFVIPRELRIYFYCCEPRTVHSIIPIRDKSTLIPSFAANEEVVFSDSELNRNNC